MGVGRGWLVAAADIPRNPIVRYLPRVRDFGCLSLVHALDFGKGTGFLSFHKMAQKQKQFRFLA
jgi:hypothetical protein